MLVLLVLPVHRELLELEQLLVVQDNQVLLEQREQRERRAMLELVLNPDWQVKREV